MRGELPDGIRRNYFFEAKRARISRFSSSSLFVENFSSGQNVGFPGRNYVHIPFPAATSCFPLHSSSYAKRLTADWSEFSLLWPQRMTVFGSLCFDIICTCR